MTLLPVPPSRLPFWLRCCFSRRSWGRARKTRLASARCAKARRQHTTKHAIPRFPTGGIIMVEIPESHNTYGQNRSSFRPTCSDMHTIRVFLHTLLSPPLVYTCLGVPKCTTYPSLLLSTYSASPSLLLGWVFRYANSSLL